MKKVIFCLSIFSLTIIASRFFHSQNPPDLTAVRTITPHTLFAEMKTNKDLFVINVLDNINPRTFYDDCHIKNSESAPGYNLVQKAMAWNKDRKIVVYGTTGDDMYSTSSYERLLSMKFTDVRLLEGGLKAWKEAGLPTEGPCKRDYLSN